MSQLIGWLFFGLIVGALARLLLPGRDPMGWLATILLGVAGAFVGGFLGSLIWKPEGGSYFHPAGFFASLLGAILLLFVWRKIRQSPKQ